MARVMKYLASGLSIVILSGCALSSASLLDDSKQYAPTSSAAILIEAPTRPYEQIGFIETEGWLNQPLPQLLESMKQKAMALGADAVMNIQDVSTQQSGGLIYNPTLGGYQSLPSGVKPKIRGIAIKYID